MPYPLHKPYPSQAGAVVVFKPGVSREQAQAALAKIADVLEASPEVRLFDPAFGGPVFYLP